MCRKAFAKKAPVFSGEKEWMERNDRELENEEMRRKAGKGGEMRNDLTEPELSGLSQGGLMKRLAEAEYPEKILESAQPFMELMSRYRCAMMEVETKLRVLDEEFSMTYDRNPFETIKSRLKRPVSIIEKMKRRGYPLTVEEIERRLNDIAGIRVICFFERDIRLLAGCLKKQADLIVISEKDYIKNPKPNGYRSFHLILGVPIYHLDGMEYYPVEIQFRTISMDFWAAMEHRICYKNQPFNEMEMRSAFLQYSDILEKMEKSFEVYSENTRDFSNQA